MKNKNQFIIIFVVIIALMTSFYWFSVRPQNIQKICWENAEKTVFGVIQNIEYDSSNSIFNDEKYELWQRAYKSCLIKNGLEK